MDVENDRNPRNLREIQEGEYTDLELTETDQTLGSNPHLNYSAWNSKENIFMSDHHSKVLAPWLIAERNWVDDEILLVHIDLHRDEGKPRAADYRMDKAFELGRPVEFSGMAYISEVIGIAEEYGLADDIYHWGDPLDKNSEPVNNLEDFNPPTQEYDKIILDVDLDFFKGLEEHPPAEPWNIEDYYTIISELENEADLSTYVTSPGFIDQEEALDHLEGIRAY